MKTLLVIMLMIGLFMVAPIAGVAVLILVLVMK